VRFPLSHSTATVLAVALAASAARAQSEWLRLHDDSSPSARLGAASAFDTARHRLVLFGGVVTRRPGGPSDETWEWDGRTWTLRAPAHRPSARSGHALAYDSTRGRCVLFGGTAAGTALGDTWEWDGDDWVHASDDGPLGRSDLALAFDAARARTILFGGRARSGAPLADAWSWDGTSWTPLPAGFGPPALAGHGMAWDATRQLVVLFGGNDNLQGSSAETWTFDGTAWTNLTASTAPAPREHLGMTWDESREQVVVFGGERRDRSGFLLDEFDDTWSLSGDAWIPVSAAARPTAITRPLLARDAACAQTLLVAYDGDAVTSLETWALVPRLALTRVSPQQGSEAGGDVLVIDGVGFADGDGLSVAVGGASAPILDVACERVRVRTPPGTGVADVTVERSGHRATLPASFEYVSPPLAARAGEVGAATGAPQDVVLVNGSAGDAQRRLAIAMRSSILVFVSAPEGRDSARFALWVWAGEPSAQTLTHLPLGGGTLVFPISSARLVLNNLGRRRYLGVPTLPSQPAPTVAIRAPRGFARPVTATVQGLIEDDAAPNSIGVSVTNAVIVDVVEDGCMRWS
jgi:IPT/TIG domain-containing protein